MPTSEPQRIESELLRSVGITALFSERQGGVSHPPYDSLNFGFGVGDDERLVEENMRRLVQQTSLSSQPHQAKQIHGIDHLTCDGPGTIHNTEADILISRTPGTSVAVRTADCLPVLLADPQAGVISAVHAGWRGSAQKVVMRAIEAMEALGADPSQVYVSIGPSIGACCFEICEKTADTLAASVSGGEKAISKSGKAHADLALINEWQLKSCGINKDRIERKHRCTCCHPGQFYSYRRDQGVTGRHLAVVALPSSI